MKRRSTMRAMEMEGNQIQAVQPVTDALLQGDFAKRLLSPRLLATYSLDSECVRSDKSVFDADVPPHQFPVDRDPTPACSKPSDRQRP